jgi:bromodomain-containing protein 7/9
LNAKAFNPPGTIYHSEAERIETWGLDRITKAAATVIEYETDWNIEIEGDDDHSAVNDEDLDDMASPAPGEEGRRSPSVASNQPQGGRRGTRAVTTAKKGATGILETFEPDGGLPGSKDGLGAFPPESDWARVMLALKLKGNHRISGDGSVLSSIGQAKNIRQRKSECE